MTWFWLAILSALLSAIAAILQKKVLKDTSPLQFSLTVSVIIAILSTLLLSIAPLQTLTLSSLGYLFIKSVLNAAAFLCIMTALKNLELSRTLPVLATAPLFIALLAYIFLGESLTALEVAGMFMIVGGTYILELKKDESVFRPLSVFLNSKYHRIILLALALMTISSVMDKFILVKFKLPALTFVIFQNYFFMIIFVLINFFTKEKVSGHNFLSGNNSILFIVIIIAIVTLAYRLAQIESVKLAPVGIVISLKRLSVLFAVLIGAKVFREENYPKKVIATVLIVAGAMLIYED